MNTSRPAVLPKQNNAMRIVMPAVFHLLYFDKTVEVLPNFGICLAFETDLLCLEKWVKI